MIDNLCDKKRKLRGATEYLAQSRGIAPLTQEDIMNVRKLFLAVFAALLLVPGATLAHDKADQLGKVTFPTSCKAKAHAQFSTGVAMLHSYWFGEARKTFEAALTEDPNCAMAYWGIALDFLGNTLGGSPSLKNLQAGAEAIEKARTMGAKTQRERDWIDGLHAYYRDYDKVPVDTRLLSYTKAMEQMARRYPNDFEVQVFYALTLQASAPKADVTYANQLKSAALLEKLYLKNPQHPGVSHFLIHAYDYPPLAAKGIAAAKRYAGLAPAAPHAQHMPSHIFTVVGMWEESIKSNEAALALQPDGLHSVDFIVYAQLQLGQDAKAKALVDAVTAFRREALPSLGAYTGLAAIPARYALDRGDWKGAAALEIISTDRPQLDFITHAHTRFSRGLGLARSGDAVGAKREIEAMEILRSALQKSDQSYWADRAEEQMLAVSAWAALAEGDKAQAEKLMRAAAEREDGNVKHVLMENRLCPMRELLAELLLEMGQAAPALREFETSLKNNPKRFRSLFGVAQAAETIGDRRKAADHYAKLMALAKSADSQRPELARAREYLAQR
jgi:tetratricopeptide (TPR) repeat protein